MSILQPILAPITSLVTNKADLMVAWGSSVLTNGFTDGTLLVWDPTTSVASARWAKFFQEPLVTVSRQLLHPAYHIEWDSKTNILAVDNENLS